MSPTVHAIRVAVLRLTISQLMATVSSSCRCISSRGHASRLSGLPMLAGRCTSVRASAACRQVDCRSPRRRRDCEVRGGLKARSTLTDALVVYQTACRRRLSRVQDFRGRKVNYLKRYRQIIAYYYYYIIVHEVQIKKIKIK